MKVFETLQALACPALLKARINVVYEPIARGCFGVYEVAVRLLTLISGVVCPVDCTHNW